MWGLAPNIAYFMTRCHKSELKWSCFRKSNYGQSAYHNRVGNGITPWELPREPRKVTIFDTLTDRRDAAYTYGKPDSRAQKFVISDSNDPRNCTLGSHVCSPIRRQEPIMWCHYISIEKVNFSYSWRFRLKCLHFHLRFPPPRSNQLRCFHHVTPSHLTRFLCFPLPAEIP